ncbi:MAG: HIT family protein, partial [Patescibacteria group bacterium]
MQKDDCAFCKIISGELPSSKIYENSEVLAFLDINPVNIGHSLVVPKKHFDNIYETPADVLANMITVAKIVSKAIKTKMKAEGINVTMNNDSMAGQVIFHSHMHIIPRFTNDGLGIWQSKMKYKEGEGKDVAERI